MPQSDALTRTRIKRVHRRLLEPAIRGPVHPVTIEARDLASEPVGFEEAAGGTFEPFEVGDAWGTMWGTTWFRITGTVPADMAGRDVVVVMKLGYAGGTGFGAEGLVWRAGEPWHGVGPNHDEIHVSSPAAGGESFDFYVEAAANPQVDAMADPAPHYLADHGGRPLLRLAACHLAAVDRMTETLVRDWTLLLDLYDHLDPETARAAQILRALDDAANLLRPDDVRGSVPAMQARLRDVLERPAHATAHHFAAVGNAHIDTAWLWPLRETMRKCARTFSTAVTLMERHPDYRFAASQAQQFEWVKQQHPALFERIRKAVAAGAFEVVGSMWVEADCNVPSGESLVRQIVLGKRFFADEFDVDTQALWLPDVFGYSAALPQILRLAGIRWFLTQKLSWNQVNRMPHHTFWWEGIDGTRVFSHFPPADTYNGDFSLDQLRTGERNFSEKAMSDRSMYLYGYGDGGGGPTEEMLHRARRLGDLEGAPQVELMTATEAFQALEAEVAASDLPVWVGELYFEMHRGTYTTHGEVKRANRKQELALREAELWAVAANDLDPVGSPYPAAELEEAWKLLLLHQFHDIIPGTSIHWVYQDTARDHAIVAATTRRLIESAVTRVASAAAGTTMLARAERPALVFNALPSERTEVVEIAGTATSVTAPALGWAATDLAVAPALLAPPVTAGNRSLDNGILRVEWDERGLLTSVRHLATGREALAPGRPGNLLQVHDDRPNVYDAWDIDAVAYDTSTDLVEAESVTLGPCTPERGSVTVVRRLGHSTITQQVRLDRGSRRVEFHTVVDWQERHVLLKAAFPLQVRSDFATFEIQFGHVRRPTHRNTSWDEARFEVCAQTWADLSEPGFGVALLNDCKYGHDVLGDVLRLTLLRSPTWPDPVADLGLHEFSYALYPHAGDVVSGHVVAEAHAFNSPLRVVEIDPSAHAAGDSDGLANRSVAVIDDEHVGVSAVKRADDGDGVIVRLYETSGGRRTVRVHCGNRRPERVDLLERPLEPVVETDIDGVTALLPLAPFEIVTLRFR